MPDASEIEKRFGHDFLPIAQACETQYSNFFKIDQEEYESRVARAMIGVSRLTSSTSQERVYNFLDNLPTTGLYTTPMTRVEALVIVSKMISEFHPYLANWKEEEKRYLLDKTLGEVANIYDQLAMREAYSPSNNSQYQSHVDFCREQQRLLREHESPTPMGNRK